MCLCILRLCAVEGEPLRCVLSGIRMHGKVDSTPVWIAASASLCYCTLLLCGCCKRWSAYDFCHRTISTLRVLPWQYYAIPRVVPWRPTDGWQFLLLLLYMASRLSEASLPAAGLPKHTGVGVASTPDATAVLLPVGACTNLCWQHEGWC